jgi:hypothetical protein
MSNPHLLYPSKSQFNTLASHAGIVNVTDVTTETLTVSEATHGRSRTFLLNHPDAITAVTLPAPKPGMKYRFIGVFVGAHTVTTDAGTTHLNGMGGIATSHTATFHADAPIYAQALTVEYLSATQWLVTTQDSAAVADRIAFT